MENILGIIASLITMGLFAPQAISVYKNRDNHQALEGVSALTSLFAILSGVLWIFYAALSSAVWIAVPSLVSVPLSSYITFVLLKSKRVSREFA